MGVRAKIHDGLLNRGAGTLTFPEVAPFGLKPATPYRADTISLDGLDSYIQPRWEKPAGTPYAKLARRLGVNVPVLKQVEQGTSRLSFEAAAALFRECGGLSLMFAFTRRADLDRPEAPVRLVDTDSQELIKPMFVATYRAEKLTRIEVARRLDKNADNVAEFEATRSSRPETIAQYFGTALGIHVEFLGLHPTEAQPPI